MDISCSVESNELLIKYKLNPDDNCEAEEWQLNLFDELLAQKNVMITPGGSAQNSSRIASFVIKKFKSSLKFNLNSKVYFIGCVGDDSNGQRLQEELIKSGVEPVYSKISGQPTGVSAGIISNGGSQRNLMANIGASRCFRSDQLHQNDEVIKSSLIYHIEGYILTHSPSIALQLARLSWQNKSILSIGLSANYIVTEQFEELMHIIPFSDIIFGNKNEAQAFHLQLKGEPPSDLNQAVKSLLELDKPKPFFLGNNHDVNHGVDDVNQIQRIVLITQGPDEVILGIRHNFKNLQLKTFSVPKLDQIGDTIGAGDAFVGGVLANLIYRINNIDKNDKNDNQIVIDEAVKCGIEIAGLVCTKRGCVIE